MINLFHRKSRRLAAAVAAVSIVTLSGLTLEYGHDGALPAGHIEVGQLQLVSIGDIAMLPGVEVIGRRDVLLAGKAGAAGGQG